MQLDCRQIVTFHSEVWVFNDDFNHLVGTKKKKDGGNF
ncbi:unknown [Bacteroides ovatus CAG:22]|nr:unknown [Bacteroides ovatus CAG:22]